MDIWEVTYSNTLLSFWSPQMSISAIDLNVSTRSPRLFSDTIWFFDKTLYRYLKKVFYIPGHKKYSLSSPLNITIVYNLLTSNAPRNADFWVSTIRFQTSFYFETWQLISTTSNKIKNYTSNISLVTICHDCT